MNILLVTHVDFWKLEMGSHQRIYALINFLSKNHIVYIAYINKKKQEDKECLVKFPKLNILFVDEFKKTNFDKNKNEKFHIQYPVLKNFYSEEIFYKLNTISLEYQFECVIIEYLHLSYFLPLFETKFLLLDTHDIMYKRTESFKKNNKAHWLEINEKEEIEIFKLYNNVITIQETEQELLISKNIKSICCPHPEKVNYLYKKQENISKNHIIFIGGYSMANKDAIDWFLDNVWNFFKNNDNIDLLIYGNVSSFFKHFDTNGNNILIKGKVENLQEVYENATIAINPVQMGGGLKIKNIEAMSFGIPLITTTEGAKGLEKGINNSFLLANSIDEWIKTLLNLLLYPKLRESLSMQAYKYISKNFNESKSFSQLEDLLKKVDKELN